MSFWSQAIEIARVDSALERRAGDVLRIVLPFGVMALIVFPLALGLRRSLLADVSAAVFWAVSVLFGMQVALRSTAADSPEVRDLHALLGVDPAARFIGRVASGWWLMAVFLIVTYVAMVVLYGPDVTPAHLPAVGLAGAMLALGMTALGTLAGEVTRGLANRTALASLLIVPLAAPMVVGASQAAEAITRGGTILPWILLLTAADLGLLATGVGLAAPLEEATR